MSTHVDVEKHFGGVDTVERFDLPDTSAEPAIRARVCDDRLMARLVYLCRLLSSGNHPEYTPCVSG